MALSDSQGYFAAKTAVLALLEQKRVCRGWRSFFSLSVVPPHSALSLYLTGTHSVLFIQSGAETPASLRRAHERVTVNLRSAVPRSLHCPRGRLARWQLLGAALGGYSRGYSAHPVQPDTKREQKAVGTRQETGLFGGDLRT